MAQTTSDGPLTFSPKQTVRKLLLAIPSRSREILSKRFGLGKETSCVTLEAIGNTYGITRERVRQVEKNSINNVRKSDVFVEEQQAFEELATLLDSLGGIATEDEILSMLARDRSTRNHVRFLLVVGDPFEYKKENPDFHHRWCLEPNLAEAIERALNEVYAEIDDEALLAEAQLVKDLLERIEAPEKYKKDGVVKRWLSISKKLGQNPLGEWGRAHSSNVKVRGLRDYAYLAIKQHGSPMHFREVSRTIRELFNRKAHEATCHNELIKDDRFVLVGRGLYALKEWGYSGGVVKDVIREILVQHPILSRDEIIEKVRTERYVKDNTIIVNLQDTALFKRNPDGTYSLRQ